MTNNKPPENVTVHIAGGDDLVCAKELASRLGHHVNYIYAMKRDGFRMPGGSSTVHAALAWLAVRPMPRRRVR